MFIAPVPAFGTSLHESEATMTPGPTAFDTGTGKINEDEQTELCTYCMQCMAEAFSLQSFTITFPEGTQDHVTGISWTCESQENHYLEIYVLHTIFTVHLGWWAHSDLQQSTTHMKENA